ncbi:MAG: RsmE family RNA methyltransferase [Planctomycetota bacterium]
MHSTRAAHRFLFDDLSPGLGTGDEIVVVGEEARHAARVKRLEAGEPVEVFDGAGLVATGRVARLAGSRQHPEVVVRLEGQVHKAPVVRPAVEVWCPMPGVDRAAGLVEQLSQCGASAWVPMRTERAQRAPTPAQFDKLRRVARESAKQCGRAWIMGVKDPGDLHAALDVGSGAGKAELLVLDAAGDAPGVLGRGDCIRVLVGPEGGWSEGERASLAVSTMVCAGPHVLRLETAAVVGTALVMAHAARGDAGAVIKE